jgi:hypothetical protein
VRESIKVLCVVAFMFAVPAAFVVWSDDKPSDLNWVFRIVWPVVSIAAMALFFKMHFRPDLAPDYLRQCVTNYYNRGGFCFFPTLSKADELCYLDIYFQNQQDAPCVGRVALRPAKNFFLDRSPIETFGVEIACPPAAFGLARLPISIPKQLQGKRQSFEVGASVEYPQGKGKTLRFRDGMVLRTNAEFGNAFHTTLIVTGALTGHIILSRPAKLIATLPMDVRAPIQSGQMPDIAILWTLGDPLLENAATVVRESLPGVAGGTNALGLWPSPRAAIAAQVNPAAEK